jgi:phosphoglycolate phosphatase-like HAD superfamily hydrolase
MFAATAARKNPSGLLVSFDIDGTLEAGDPPGPVTFALVAEARARGYVIGSASDRTLSEQRAIWQQAGIRPDFTCHKHRLKESTAPFGCQRMLHIGDTSLDEYYARLAGFEFRYATDLSLPLAPG